MPAKPKRKAPAYSQSTVDLIYAGVKDGLTHAAAAILAGVSRETLAQWKKQEPEFRDALARAEAECQKQLLENIRNGVTAKGEHDWKTDVWLLEHRFRADFGATAKAETNLAAAVVITIPETERQKLIARRKAALEQST